MLIMWAIRYLTGGGGGSNPNGQLVLNDPAKTGFIMMIGFY